MRAILSPFFRKAGAVRSVMISLFELFSEVTAEDTSRVSLLQAARAMASDRATVAPFQDEVILEFGIRFCDFFVKFISYLLSFSFA